MSWRKSSPALIARFEALVPSDARVERRQMFGYPAAFLAGHLFMSLFEERLLLRLGERDRTALLALPGARTFEPMPGRAMREYVMVPGALVADDEALEEWIACAVSFAGALPPKKAKATTKKAKATAKKPKATAKKKAPRPKK